MDRLFALVDISIHAPLAGRDANIHRRRFRQIHFNPRAPRGARLWISDKLLNASPFQSTRPSRGATWTILATVSRSSISIHAPLAGRDPEADFYRAGFGQFQSTRPSRGATAARIAGSYLSKISIHAPLAGRDRLQPGRHSGDVHISIHAPLAGRDAAKEKRTVPIHHFNPRAPRGARPPWEGKP